MEDFVFYFPALNGVKNCALRVEKGFKTDFGSVPQAFQSFVSPIGKPTKAYVLHDRLCVANAKGEIWEKFFNKLPRKYWNKPITRKEADKVFLEAMKTLGVGALKRYIIYFYVRLYAILKGRR
ncbi:DUF1353 domain-containing protein [Helicobacter winghamensis]|uniref:DUF1353 domain-containing protein n=1 Tax=Helicobacter winghamensis TaxID=157268 RepID=UPI0027A1A31D